MGFRSHWPFSITPRYWAARYLLELTHAPVSDWLVGALALGGLTVINCLGVRAGELRGLHLEDIEWTQGLVHIRQSKTGRGRTLPLPEDAGELLVRYLREERPTTPYRQVFLSFASPRRPIGSCVTTSLVKNFLKKLDLDGPGRGAHSFRHTAASLMVENGATLKEVADVLGHRALSTTGIYIKLDTPSLREVAMPWKGGNV